MWWITNASLVFRAEADKAENVNDDINNAGFIPIYKVSSGE